MDIRRGVLAVTAVAIVLLLPPAAVAAHPLSVRYESRGALRGLNVLARIPALHIAKVSGGDITTLRNRRGIRWVQRTVQRRDLGWSLVSVAKAISSAEWEYAATRSNLVPTSVQHAASSITIAVIDTGADLRVPSLAAKSPIAYNAVTGTTDVTDSIGHGTFVASLAAGASTSGLHGFAGDAKLMIVRAIGDAHTFDDVNEAAGVVWAVDHGAKIINISIAGADTSQAEQDGIQYAISHGVLVVAAAGNAGLSSNVPSYPAALLGADGLAVGASTPRGHRASFSTVAPYVSLLAPGVSVLGAATAVLSPKYFPRADVPPKGSYAFGSGTSFAAPQVAGAAALVWAANPSLTAQQVAQILEQTAVGNGTRSSAMGYGVLDVAAAVAKALGVPAPARH